MCRYIMINWGMDVLLFIVVASHLASHFFTFTLWGGLLRVRVCTFSPAWEDQQSVLAGAASLRFTDFKGLIEWDS